MRSLFTAKFTAIVIVLIVFVVDCCIPLGLSVGALYIISLPILLLEKKQTVVLFTIAISFLIFLNLFLFSDEDTPWYIYINRIISAFSVLVISLFLIRYKILKDRKETIKEAHQKALEEMLFITNHKVRHPVATLSGMIHVLESSSFSDQESNEIIKLMQKPIHELDDFTKELTHFISERKI